MALGGGCFCGAIRYEIGDRPFNKTICHCPTCRGVSGTASVAWCSVAESDYRIVAGSPARFASSEHVERTFCSACGTHLTYRNRGLGEIDVTICSLDDPEPHAPQDHTFAKYRLGWDHCNDGLPAYQGLRSEG